MAHDFYSVLVARVLFPMQEWMKGHDTGRRLSELLQSERWEPGRLGEYQIGRLRRLLTRAGERVPYYRDLFTRTGFRPEAVRGADDLLELPFLTKPEVRAHHDALVADGAKRLAQACTGGSTGEPLRFRVGTARNTSDVALRRRAMRWWGLDVGDPEVVLWGLPIEATKQDWIRELRDRVFRSKFLSVNRLTVERIDEYLDIIRQVRPAFIYSHPSGMEELARRAEERGCEMDALGIRVAFLSAEELYPHQRSLLERVYGCRVANWYGGRDSGLVAVECPEGGLHLNAEDILVEIVSDEGARLPHGTPGEIVVTHLASDDYPFIRYRTGDVGVLGDAPCRCGRGLPLLREIHGRADDLLLGLDGARVPGQVAVTVLRALPGLHAFKIVQEGRDLIHIRLVTSKEFPKEGEDVITRGIRTILGDAMRVEFSRVETITAEASGKYRTVVNRIRKNGTNAARR